MGSFVRVFGDWDHYKARTQDHEVEHAGKRTWAAADRGEASKRAAAAREEYIVNMFEGNRGRG